MSHNQNRVHFPPGFEQAPPSQQQSPLSGAPTADTFYDCDDLLNWLLQNPENSDPYSQPSIFIEQPVAPFPLGYSTNNYYPTGLYYSNNQYIPGNGNVLPQVGLQHYGPSTHIQPSNYNIASNMSSIGGIGQSTQSLGYYQRLDQSMDLQPTYSSGLPNMSKGIDAYDQYGDSSGSDDETSSVGKRKRDPNGNSSNKHSSSSQFYLPSGVGKRKSSKETLQDMEHRVKELEEENAVLREHMTTVTQRTTDVQRKRAAMERLMAEKVSMLGDNDNGNQGELAELVSQYTEIYADYGKCRQREVAFHLNQLEKLLTPTQTTKMFLWTLHQDKSFFDTDKSPLFDILMKELALRPEQLERIQHRRPKVQELIFQLRESFDLIQSLRTVINSRHECLDSRCSAVQNGSSAKQIVYFLLWISRNVQKLNSCIPNFTRSTAGHTLNSEFAQNSTVDTSTGDATARIATAGIAPTAAASLSSS